MGVEILSDGWPQVSVLMAVHNGERHLEEALRSVMGQTLRNIEIIVVDDASTDGTAGILAHLAREDARIRVVRSEINLRLTRALNLGLESVRAPLVARMDADDVSLPRRLEVQKAFLDEHPEVTLVGASIEAIDGEGRSLRRSIRSRDSVAIGWLARFGPGVPHPTFMFRTRGPDGSPLRYDGTYALSQDYEFICRILGSGLHAVCLPDVLLRYRRHGGAVSSTRSREQRAAAKAIGTKFQRDSLPEAVFDALADARAIHFDGAPATPRQIRGLFAGARAMLDHDAKHHPDRAAWIRRQTAQLLATSLQRGGASASAIVRAFLRHGPDLLAPLALRILEARRLLPAHFRSDPSLTGVVGRRSVPDRPRTVADAGVARLMEAVARTSSGRPV